jgi:hypothetical protein
MKVQGAFPVPNALLLLMGSDRGEVPQSMDGKDINATSSCVAIGVAPPVDADTLVILTNEISEKLGKPDFDGSIPTPSKRISLFSVEHTELLGMNVSSDRVNVQVYVPSRMRDRVVIVIYE